MKFEEVVQEKIVVYIRYDDWEVLYLNGKKADENHKISSEDMLDHVCSLHQQIDNCDVVVIWDETDFLFENGKYPDTLQEAIDIFSTELYNVNVSQFSKTLSMV